METYKTIDTISTATIIEKKSEFIGTLAPATTEEQALTFLQDIRTKHRTANHNVFAFRLVQDAKERCSDDGEPSKTAGYPILHVLSHAQLNNCILVVTRYFGGTLLGTGGLVRAYTAAAKATLDTATIVTMQLCVPFTLSLQYTHYEKTLRLLATHKASWQEPIFTDSITIQALLPQGDETALLQDLQEYSSGAINAIIDPPIFTAFSPTPFLT